MTHARISTDPAVMMGKPCIKGTHVTVELILRKLGARPFFCRYPRSLPTADRGRLAGGVGVCCRLHATRDRSRRVGEHGTASGACVDPPSDCCPCLLERRAL